MQQVNILGLLAWLALNCETHVCLPGLYVQSLSFFGIRLRYSRITILESFLRKREEVQMNCNWILLFQSALLGVGLAMDAFSVSLARMNR